MVHHINLVYAGLSIVFLCFIAYMFLYGRGLKTRNSNMGPESEIAPPTQKKEREGRTGTIT